MKKNPVTIYQCNGRCTATATGKTDDQDAVYWIKLSRAQDQGLRFWKTKSIAIIVHHLVPGDCTYRVNSQTGDRTLSEGLQTPRPAPRVTLRSSRQSQQQHLKQQQQQHSESASTSVGQLTRDTEKNTCATKADIRN